MLLDKKSLQSVPALVLCGILLCAPACNSSGRDTDIVPLTLLQTVAAASATSVTVTCTGSSLSAIPTSLSPESGVGISDQFLTSGQQIAYAVPMTVAGDLLVGIDSVETFPFDTKISFCGTDGSSLLKAEDAGRDGEGEALVYSTSTAGVFYMVVQAGEFNSADSGTFSVDAANAQVAGGGSCSNMATTAGSVGLDFTDGECINFETDTVNPSGMCANFNGTYSTGNCSDLNVQGRCTTLRGGTSSGGVFTVLGYTGNFASDDAFRASCDVDLDTALGDPQYIYTAQ